MEGVMPIIALSQTQSLTHPTPAVLMSVVRAETIELLEPAPFPELAQAWLIKVW